MSLSGRTISPAAPHATRRIPSNGRTGPIPAVLTGVVDSLPNRVPQATRIPLGTYRGLNFGLVLRPQFPSDVYLEGSTKREETLSREHAGPRAILNALERLSNAYSFACDAVRQNLAVAEGQLRDYQLLVGKLFTHEAYLAELAGLGDQLKSGLSGTTQKQGDDRGPDISELAARIKALKAAHTVEASGERVRQVPIAAEEPITSRIRRHPNRGRS